MDYNPYSATGYPLPPPPPLPPSSVTPGAATAGGGNNNNNNNTVDTALGHQTPPPPPPSVYPQGYPYQYSGPANHLKVGGGNIQYKTGTRFFHPKWLVPASKQNACIANRSVNYTILAKSCFFTGNAES